MKKLLLSISFVLASLAAFAQAPQDNIVMSDNDTILCRIQYVSQNIVAFIPKGRVEQSKVPFELIKSYTWNGETSDLTAFDGTTNWRLQEAVNEDEVSLHLAGDYLIRSGRRFYTGVGLTLVGVALSGGAGLILANQSNGQNPSVATNLVYVGVGLSCVGSIISATAFVPITRAGIELKKVKFGKP